jgi:lysyl-tRNA synthetase class 2
LPIFQQKAAAVSAPTDDFEANRAEKLRKIEELGLDPWGSRFDGHQAIGDILRLPADLPEGQRPKVRAAGRIVLRRIQGNVHFVDLWDWTTPLRDGERGKVQVYVGKKQVGDQAWKLAQLLDLGDLLGVEGTFGKTRMGEPTIFAEKLHYLGKSLLPHPDKHSGMQDIEFRLRHRYLDLIYTPESLDRATKRVRIIRTIRRYLDDLGFCEVETPTLHAIAGGAAARPFITHHNALDIDLYLRIALELHLKRLLVGGMEKVYEIGRVFRNEGIDARHNPEFTMLELYQSYADYQSMMDLTEGLIVRCVETIGPEVEIEVEEEYEENGEKKTRKVRQKYQGIYGCWHLPYAGNDLNFSPPWKRASYGELFREHVGVSMDDSSAVRAAAEKIGFPTAGKHPDVIVHHLFEELVEDKLAGPVFVYDYPASLCPLTKRKKGNPAIAERFELYVQGMELANAYTELNDPLTQEAAFRHQLAGLPEEESMAKMDEDFVRALKHGMPPAGGLGIGIDRLLMLLTNTQTIRDVILFPLLRPEKSG